MHYYSKRYQCWFNLTHPKLLWQKTVEKDPEKIALIEAHTQRKFTFKEIDELSNQFAWVLKKYDVKPSSVVAIMVTSYEIKHNRLLQRCLIAWST